MQSSQFAPGPDGILTPRGRQIQRPGTPIPAAAKKSTPLDAPGSTIAFWPVRRQLALPFSDNWNSLLAGKRGLGAAERSEASQVLHDRCQMEGAMMSGRGSCSPEKAATGRRFWPAEGRRTHRCPKRRVLIGKPWPTLGPGFRSTSGGRSWHRSTLQMDDHSLTGTGPSPKPRTAPPIRSVLREWESGE